MKKFVKIIKLVTICLLISTILLGCSRKATTENIQVTKPKYDFAEFPMGGNKIESYRNEYKKRIESNTFKNEDEIAFLESMGYFVYTGGGYFQINFWNSYGIPETYSDPIVYQTDNGIEVLGIKENGELCAIKIKDVGVWAFDEEKGEFYLMDIEKGYDKEYLGLIHYTAKESEEILQSNEYWAISYNAENGMIKHWEYGEMIGQAKVPAKSVYVGCCNGVGYLFKDGTDVWAVRSVYNNDERCKDSEIIARNVEFVITSSHYVYVDEYQPLFLMNDGTLKTYSHWEGDYDAPMDDESHLLDVQYEGEVNKSYN